MEGAGLRAGFAMVDITPPLGVCMAGYFSRREASGILDPLYASAVAVSDGVNRWILISCDLLGLGDEYVRAARGLIEGRTGVAGKDVMIHSTHIHTGPVVRRNPRERGEFAISELDEAYLAMLVRKLADAAQMALGGMREATLEIGYGEERSISFIRRFRMKDGTVKTNPGVGNPDIIEPMGEIDPSVGVVRLRFVDGEGEILIVNFALHPDIIGGTLLSADYPGHMRRAIARQLPSSHALFINGAAGDINHIDAMHPGRTSKGYEYSRKVGTILAAEVLKVYQRMAEIRLGANGGPTVKSASKMVRVPLRRVSKEEEEDARKLLLAFKEGKWRTKSMSDVADLAAAYQTLDLARSEGQISLEIQALSLGEIAFLGLPGEVFVDIGRRIKEGSPYPYTFVVELANGSFGYFPTCCAFSEGGYESKNSPFTPELEGILVEGALELLAGLR